MPPSAVGTLARTPLAHALVYIRNKRLTGRFELRARDGRGASLTCFRGRIASAMTAPPVSYFGSIAYELGLIDAPALDASLLELATTKPKRLHGDILVERGALTIAQRDQVLREQICRKVHHLFTYPEDAEYAFHDVQPGAVAPPLLVDPLAPAWRGLRDDPPRRAIEDALARVGGSALEMVNEGAVFGASLGREESALARRLAERPMTVSELRAATFLSPLDVDLVIYLLLIAKCVEPISGVRAAPTITGMPPAAAPSLPPPAIARSGALPAIRNVSSSHPPPMRPPAVRPVIGPADLGPAALAARARAIGSEDYFEVLGVDRDASVEAIRAAYFRLAKVWHPDRLPKELAAFRSEVEEIFAHMTRVQQTLCDPEAKRRWMESRGLLAAARPRNETMRDIEHALARKDFATVESASRALVEAGGEDAEALALVAWAEARGGEAAETAIRAALVALDHAVHVDRTCERALYYRGCIAKKLGKVDAAFRDFARVIHLNPKHVDATREVRLFEMRARKGSGEHSLGSLIDKVTRRKNS